MRCDLNFRMVDSWDSTKVYPLVFGDGVNTFMSIALDSYYNEDIIVAGIS